MPVRFTLAALALLPAYVTAAVAASSTAVVPNLNGTYEQQVAALRSLPADVRDFVERRANCNHWSGEEPYDADRKAKIEAAVKELRCASLSKDESEIRLRHGRTQAVLTALEATKDWCGF